MTLWRRSWWGAWLAAGAVAWGLAAYADASDPVRGEQLYVCCAACHALAYDRVGPRH